MDEDNSRGHNVVKKIQELVESNCEFIDMNSNNFNKLLDHLYSILESALVLLKSGNNAIPIFLAITAIEEKAKIEVYTCSKAPEKHSTLKQKRGGLYNHKTKHMIAPSPVLQMGKRLEDVLGREKLNFLLKKSYNESFCMERENSLYFQISPAHNAIIPMDQFSLSDAKDFLFFAIEIIDDGLVGYTDYSINVISPKLDALWQIISNIDNDD